MKAAGEAGRPNFLDAIKSGVKLKKVEKVEQPASKSQKSNAMMSELMQAMARTRKQVAQESDVSDSDSDGLVRSKCKVFIVNVVLTC